MTSEHTPCHAAVDAVAAERDAALGEVERLRGQLDELRYNYRLSEEQYQAEAKHSIKLERAIKSALEDFDRRDELSALDTLRAALGVSPT